MSRGMPAGYTVEESFVEAVDPGLMERIADMRSFGLSSRAIIEWLGSRRMPVDAVAVAQEQFLICLRLM